MVQMVLYTTAGGLVPVPGKPTLAELQKHVGGYIERVALPKRITAWVDEEGLLKELLPSLIVRHRDDYPVSLCGPVVFVVQGAVSPEDAAARVLANVIHVQFRRASPGQSTVTDPPPPTPR